MQLAGIGALFAAFEKLKEKLEAEGLFDPTDKKPLRESVGTVGVITAKTGAVIRDILKVIASRAPRTDILLRNVLVQGEQAPGEIVTALEEMNEYKNIDCIVLGRGGGSIEDLWAFNDEKVVRAIFKSAIPVISAVGHEIDFTLSDFVADVRAPTPSAAAEMVVPDERENKRYFEEMTKRFSSVFQHYIGSVYETFNGVIYNPVFKRALHFISDARQQCDTLHEDAVRAIGNIIQKNRAQLSKNSAQMQALNPLAVLSRGYSVVSKERKTPVKDAGKLKKGDSVHIQFHKGEASADITSVEK
jgi:exodeoxyribonuclease VII large subunit